MIFGKRDKCHCEIGRLEAAGGRVRLPPVLTTPIPDHDGSTPLGPLFRVVVLGNSQALVVATHERNRDHGTYGQLLELRLRDRGIQAHVIHEARWWDLIHQLRPRLVPAVAQHMPDVVVLGYGMGECEANIPPTWVMRKLDDARWTPSLNPLVAKARNATLPTLDRLKMWSYRRIVPRLGKRTWRLTPSRFEAELDRVISWTRRQTGGLVLVLTLHDPGEALERLLPGFRKRADLFNTIIRSVVARLGDPNVIVVDAGSEIDRLTTITATLDGLHYTPAGHEAIAASLDEIVAGWLASRGTRRATARPAAETKAPARRASARRRTPSG